MTASRSTARIVWAVDALARLREDPGRAAILLDIDGTLAPIVERPEDAAVPDETREVLRGLVERYALVGAISGRAGAARLASSSSVAGRAASSATTASSSRTTPTAWRGRLRAFRDERRRGRSRTRASRSRTTTARIPTTTRRARSWSSSPSARATTASARASGGWCSRCCRRSTSNKGTAVRALLARAGLARALFAGDDTTDLDAFRAVDELEVGVKVAVDSAEAPPELRARRRRRRPRHRGPRRAAEDAVNQGPLPQRLRLGPVELDRYLAGQLSGLAYMRRLRAIEDEEARHLRELGDGVGGARRGERRRRRVRPRVARGRRRLELPPRQRPDREPQRVLRDRGARPDEPAHRHVLAQLAAQRVRRRVDPRALPGSPGPGPYTKRENVLQRRDRRLPAARLAATAARRGPAAGRTRLACRRAARRRARRSRRRRRTCTRPGGRPAACTRARRSADRASTTRPRTTSTTSSTCAASSVSSQSSSTSLEHTLITPRLKPRRSSSSSVSIAPARGTSASRVKSDADAGRTRRAAVVVEAEPAKVLADRPGLALLVRRVPDVVDVVDVARELALDVVERAARPQRERVPEVEDHRAHSRSTSHARATSASVVRALPIASRRT